MSRPAPQISRRDLLRSFMHPGSLGGREPAIRLPYATDPPRFAISCPECTEQPCRTACPQGIVQRDADGIPCLDLSRQGCTFCQDCARACPHGVLDPAASTGVPGRLVLSRDDCLAWQRTICSCCTEICPEWALISLGDLQPRLIEDSCTCCGLCVGICPTGALRVSGLERE